MEAPRAAERLQLVFRGEYVDGQEPQAVRDAVVRALRLDASRAARLFSGRRVVLRRAVDAATAHRFIARFEALGAVVRAEPARHVPAPAAPPAPAVSRPTARAVAPVPWGRVLRWTGLGLALGVGALLLGPLVAPPLGSGLRSLRSEAPPARAPGGATAPAGTGAAPGAALPSALSTDASRDYHQRYLPAPRHKAFAVSPAGGHGWHAGAPSRDAARETALARCRGALPAGTDGCRIVDADGERLE